MSPSGRFILAPGARRDLALILRASGRQFGPLQQERYAVLLRSAIARVAEEPHCIGSKSRDDILDGLRSFHLGLSARRQGAASHALYYEQRTIAGGTSLVVILRILHDHMDPDLHIEREPE
jgi:toxin ParE1/3/4